MDAMANAANVVCYAGYRAEQEPRRFSVGDEAHEVMEIIRRWRDPEVDGFIVRTGDHKTYELHYERSTDRWTAVLRAR